MDNKELCKWLIANSAGTYRNSAAAAMVIGSQDERIAELELNYGLMKISRDTARGHLESCENALSGRDERIAELEEIHAVQTDAIFKLEEKLQANTTAIATLVNAPLIEEPSHEDLTLWVAHMAEEFKSKSEMVLLLESHMENDEIERRCKEYMDFIRSDNFHEDKMNNYENAIFEAAIIQVCGHEIFDEINSRLD